MVMTDEAPGYKINRVRCTLDDWEFSSDDEQECYAEVELHHAECHNDDNTAFEIEWKPIQ